MNQWIDLHVHSTGSDGTLSPEELIRHAGSCGLTAVALTDHDSVSGIPEAVRTGLECGVEVVPGVELSTDYEDHEIHVLGYYIDTDNEQLLQQLRTFRDNRDNRNLKMIDRLAEYGYRITAQEIYDRNPDSVIARPHIARFLVDTNQVPDIQTVFDTLIGEGCVCYVDRYKITPMRAVELIRNANGIAVLAHPCLYKLSGESMVKMIDELTACGLDGIEAVYSLSTPEQEAYYRTAAAKRSLLITGGSDFHGSNKPDIRLGTGRGNLRIPYQYLQDIRDLYQKRMHS